MYTKEQLLALRNSPLAQGRPKDLGTIRGVTKDTLPLKKPPRRRTKSEPPSSTPKQEPPIKEPLKFKFITRVGGLNGSHFQENYRCVGLDQGPCGAAPIYQKKV